MTIPALIAIALLGAVIYLMNRIEHGIIYWYQRAVRLLRDTYVPPLMPTRLKWWDQATFWKIRGIHKSGHAMHVCIGLLSFVAALGWTGLSWRGVAASVLIACEYYLIADSLGQTYINDGSDDYSDEPSKWQWPAAFVLGMIALVLGVQG